MTTTTMTTTGQSRPLSLVAIIVAVCAVAFSTVTVDGFSARLPFVASSSRSSTPSTCNIDRDNNNNNNNNNNNEPMALRMAGATIEETDSASTPETSASGSTVTVASTSNPSFSVDFERRPEYPTPERPFNDLMIRAAFGEPVERTPIWLFRQAGRHLPEYHAYKEETNKIFLELISDDETSSECVMMPLRRYELDAGILFSDILTLAEALDVEMFMGNGFSLHLPNEIVTVDEMYHRVKRPEQITYEFVRDRLGYVMNCIVATRKKMNYEEIEIPLIGFSGAPYTIMYYMLGGTSKLNNEIGMKWLRENEEASIDLLKSITKLAVEYLSMQVEAGAHMLQLFEAMGMMIDEELFMKYALPCHEIIAAELKARYPDIPLMVFARGAK